MKPKLRAGLHPVHSSDVCSHARQAKVKESNGLFSAVSCWEQRPCPPVCHNLMSGRPALFTPPNGKQTLPLWRVLHAADDKKWKDEEGKKKKKLSII